MYFARLLSAFLGIGSAPLASATCPLLDLVEYQGKHYALAQDTSPPRSVKLSEWTLRLPPCSAPGQGRASYRIEDSQVFLVGYRGCSSTLGVAEALGITESKLPAHWLSGRINVALGSCFGGWDPANEWFTVEQGRLIEFVSKP